MVLLITGCALDPVDEAQVDQAADVVTEPATPLAYCVDCVGARVAGEPVTLTSQFLGVCDGLFGDYECDKRSYRLTAACTTGSCNVPPPKDIVGRGNMIITPNAAGTITLRATMVESSCVDDGYGEDICTSSTNNFTLPSFTTHVPDDIGVECTAGPDRHPCVDGSNARPVVLSFTLLSGSTELHGDAGFEVDATAEGAYWGDAGWQSYEVGHVSRVRYGSIERDLDITVGLPFDRVELAEAPIDVPAER